jgi:predicted O-linked N-acetylglucosamine transferase (SPINDLY family)
MQRGLIYDKNHRYRRAAGALPNLFFWGWTFVEPTQSDVPEATYLRALGFHQEGRLPEALAGYEQVLALEPAHSSALTMLGVIALENGNPAAAVDLLGKAVLSDARNTMAHVYRGLGFSALNRHEDSVDCYDQAIAVDPDFSALPYYSRANALMQLGRYDSALASYDEAIAFESDLDAEAFYERGTALMRLARHEAALESFERAIALGSKNATEAHFERGNLLTILGRQEAARACFERLLNEHPEHAYARYNLGRLQHQLGDFDAALRSYEAAMRAKPDLTVAFVTGAELSRSIGRVEDAEQVLLRGLQHNPAHAPLHNSLGNVFRDGGDIGAALQCYDRALELDPDNLSAHSDRIFSLMFESETPEPMLEEARRFDARFAAPLTCAAPPIDPLPVGPIATRLRIGYVSPDFRKHCQSLFTLPLLSHHDRSAFEIVCYSSTTVADETTRRIEQQVDQFHAVAGLDDAALAARVRADRIDILVDLTMHMGNGRPLLFARRPAPVQVAWLAYPGTTGLQAMDYRLSDPRLDPPGYDAHYSERTVRLPDSFWCYDPLSSLPAATTVPAIERGTFTLGCLNNACKLTDRTLRLWAPLLKQLPQARLLLLAPTGRYRQAILRRAVAAGLDAARIEFVPNRPREQYLASYRHIDLCVDTSPYNGHTTSLDALWMGVPVVTRIGSTSVGRGGLSLLHQLELTELAAESDADFLEIVLALTKDLPRLAALRRELRPRLQRSPLMDGRRFASHIEAAYREMWAQRIGVVPNNA